MPSSFLSPLLFPLRFVGLLVFLGLAGSAGIGCGAQTAGKRVFFEAAAQAVVAKGHVTDFTTAQGWTIRLESAYFLVGPLVLFEGQGRVALWDLLVPWGVAHADPGHASTDTRRIVGENTELVLVDLLKASPTPLGLLPGIESTVQSAEIRLLPPSSARTSKALEILDGATLLAFGTATQGGQTERFQLRLTIPDEGTMRSVDGIQAEFSLQDKRQKPGKVLLQLHLDQWFSNLDFAKEHPKDPEGRKLLTENDAAALQGLRSRFSYSLLWSAP